MGENLKRTIKRAKELDAHLATHMAHTGASKKEIDEFLAKRLRERRIAIRDVMKKKKENEKRKLDAERKERITKLKTIQLKKK